MRALDHSGPALSELPEWLRPLAQACSLATADEFPHFLPPEDGSARPSAVLIAFSETDDGPGLLLIERAATLRTHAGQAAFPGGATDPHDASATDTALREANEEVGLEPGSVVVLSELPALYVRPTRFAVTPVLAWWAHPHAVGVADPAEVAAVAVVPVAKLADPANRFRVQHPSGMLGVGFEVDGLFIWGFTAGLVDRLLEFGGWSREWDRRAVREIP